MQRVAYAHMQTTVLHTLKSTATQKTVFPDWSTATAVPV